MVGVNDTNHFSEKERKNEDEESPDYQQTKAPEAERNRPKTTSPK